MTKIEKDKLWWGKTSAIGLGKYVKIKALNPLLFPRKTRVLFAIFESFFSFIRLGKQIKGLGSKFDKVL